MISVVIPLYNGEKYIARSVRSVLSQTFQDFEIIVVDDGSVDGGKSVVQSISDGRIRVISQANKGVSAARNAGIAAAQYDIVAFLDADDEWLPNHLSTIHELILAYPDCGVFGTSYYTQKAGETPTLPSTNGSIKGTRIMTDYFKVASGADFPMQTSAYAVRKEKILAIGGFPVGIPSGEDILTLARLQTVCEFAYSSEPTSIYYLTTDATKSVRPIKTDDPLDAMFEEVYKRTRHKEGSRLYLASWYKRRMSGAILAHRYALGFRMFGKALRIMPFQRKLYTSLGITLFSSVTGISLYDINKRLKKH